VRGVVYLLGAVVVVSSVVVYVARAAGDVGAQDTSSSGIKLPPGYRDWKLISVAHDRG
jgi:hypothetical protein